MEKEEIKKLIDEYFGQVPHRVSINNVGKIVYLDVHYEDFKPACMVRADLEGKVPFSCCENVDRRYSNKVVTEQIMSMYDSDVDVLVRDESGAERRVPMTVYIEELLFYRVL